MANRISVLVALEGADDGLKRAVSSAERSLGELASSAKTAGQRAAAGMAEVKAGVSALGDQVSRAKTQLFAFLTLNWAAGKVQEIVQVADAWNGMTARLKLATAGSREFTTAQTALFDIAQRIGVPLQETTKLYGRLQQAVRMLGGEQKDALSITESVAQALRISGATATEAQASLLQFGQALASGVLRGDEFNSVMENSPRLAQALADGLNVPIGRLRQMAEQGRLTADIVVKALMSQKDKLASEYAQLPQTVSQAMERLKNAFGQWLHEVDASTGLTQKLSAALTWLSQNLDTVMRWITRLSELGLAVLIYRLIPALIIAWQTAGAAAVTAASASAAAWATANLSVGAAIKTAGALKVAYGVLGAFFVGWEIGTWLSEKFEIVRKAGIFMVQVLLTYFEQLRYSWEAFKALFTSDTISEATKRHEARLAEMKRIFAEMVADASKGTEAAKGAMNTAASAAEEITKRLQAVRQGTQEAVGRGIEAVHSAVEKLHARLGQVEQKLTQAQQTVSDATAKMAEAYRGLTTTVEESLQKQVEAIKTRYQQERAELERSSQSEAARIEQSTQLLVDALKKQTILRQQATTETLKLIEEESSARLEAARRQGQTDAERAANVQRVENEILATQRQTLTQALAEYRQHIDALNSEANRHLAEVKRLEDEKRLLHASTEERIRELQRSTMTAYQAYQSKLTEVAELQEKARTALNAGEFEQAKTYAKQAQDLAAQTAQAVKQGDQEVISQKMAVQKAIEAIRASEELATQALEREGAAHQEAASQALSARGKISQTLRDTHTEIDGITATLKDGLTLTIDADTTRLDKALAALDKAFAEKERLLVIQADLTQAEKTLQALEQQLKEGKTLLVDADVSQAKTALEQLHAYAKETSQLDLTVSTDKAQAAISNVEAQIQTLSTLHTESQHLISTNADAARSEIRSLDGGVTHSEHIIHVRRVEEHALGGLVGGGLRRFAQGGQVSPLFPRMSEGSVPGSGHHDTVPRTLEAGAFVLRKAAVQKYGASRLAALVRGVAHFATGGKVDRRPPEPPKQNREIIEAFKLIELGLRGMDEYTSHVESSGGTAISPGMRQRTMDNLGTLAYTHRTWLEPLLTRKQLTSNEHAILEGMQKTWRQAMAQPLLWGEDLERELLAYMETRQGEFYARGGVARSDRVPALLTPGEYVVNKTAVNRYGAGFFEAINAMALPAHAIAQRVRGYATGGLVSGLAARASGLLKQASGADLGALLSESLASAMRGTKRACWICSRTRSRGRCN